MFDRYSNAVPLSELLSGENHFERTFFDQAIMVMMCTVGIKFDVKKKTALCTANDATSDVCTMIK